MYQNRSAHYTCSPRLPRMMHGVLTCMLLNRFFQECHLTCLAAPHCWSKLMRLWLTKCFFLCPSWLCVYPWESHLCMLYIHISMVPKVPYLILACIRVVVYWSHWPSERVRQFGIIGHPSAKLTPSIFRPCKLQSLEFWLQCRSLIKCLFAKNQHRLLLARAYPSESKLAGDPHTTESFRPNCSALMYGWSTGQWSSAFIFF